METSRGKEALFGVAAAEVDVIASGQGRLSEGTARIEFDRLFAESISGPDALRVTVTPVGGWSALYVERIDESGFDLRSEAGNKDVEFHWVAVGRAAGHERRPEVVLPDVEEARELARQKNEESRSRRPVRRERPTVITVEQ